MIEQLDDGRWYITATQAVNPVWWCAWSDGVPVAYGSTSLGNQTTVGRDHADIFATEAECRARVEELGGEWTEMLDTDYEVIE